MITLGEAKAWLAALVALWNEGKFDEAAAFFAEKITVVTPDAEMVLGSRNLIASYRQTRAQYPQCVLICNTREVRGVGDGATILFDMRLSSKKGKPIMDGLSLSLLQRNSNGQIQSVQSMSVRSS